MPRYYRQMRGVVGPQSSGRALTKVNDALNNLNRILHKMKSQSLQGLIRIQARIHKEMDTIPPKIPVEYGNLRRSYFCVTSKGAIRAGSLPAFTNERKAQGRLEIGHTDAIYSALGVATQYGKTSGPAVVFGFSAYYAPYVHEMYGPGIKWTRANSGPGFFVAAVRRARLYGKQYILEEIRRKRR